MLYIIQQMNIIKDKLTKFYPFLIIWYLFLSKSKSSFMTSSASSLIMISMLSLFECIITPSSPLSKEEIKLFVIDNWIFHGSDFLRLFMMSFLYGLILSRHSSIDTVLLELVNTINRTVTPKIICSYCFIKIFISLCSKRFLTSLSILLLIALVYFARLKRFLISLTAV